jgi:hypothetical protein
MPSWQLGSVPTDFGHTVSNRVNSALASPNWSGTGCASFAAIAKDKASSCSAGVQELHRSGTLRRRTTSMTVVFSRWLQIKEL